MDRLPPLPALRVFEAAARHLSFNRAAEELSVTPSAVSHQVRALEAFLGVALFHRASRQVSLSAEGLAYFAPVHAALEQVRGATQALTGARERGPLTVSVAPSFAMGWLLSRLPRFQVDHPEIDVRVSSSVEVVDLALSDVDVGIRSGRGEWPNLRCHRLMAEDLVAVCRPSYARELGLTVPADLARAMLLHDYSRLGRWRSWLSQAGATDVDPEAGHKFQTTTMAVDAAASGLGVCITDRKHVTPYLADGRLFAPFDIDVPSGYSYFLVYPEHRARVPKIAAFRKWIVAEAARSPDDAAEGPESATV